MQKKKKHKQILNSNAQKQILNSNPQKQILDSNPRNSKPISKLRTCKASLDHILSQELSDAKQIIFNAVTRTHKIVIHVYQFIRFFILNQYHKNLIIPHISKDFISMAFKAIIRTSVSGPTPKGNNLRMFNRFKLFYESDYKNLGYTNKIDGSNLSQILMYMETDILTNIENNIKMHFLSYVKRFVNSSFRKQNNELLEKVSKGGKYTLRKILNKDLYEIKQDLFNNTLLCNQKYHEWIKTHRNNIFPQQYNESYEFDVQYNPQKYIKHMIYMCLELEKIEAKSFQFFPLRTCIIPKYIPIDTASLIDLFITKDKKKYLDDIDGCKCELWGQLLNTRCPMFEQKIYSFDFRMITDGYSGSFQFIHKDMKEIEKTKKNNMKHKRQTAREIYEGLSSEEIDAIKINKDAEQKEKKEVDKIRRKQFIDKKRAEFKNLPKKDQETQRERIKKQKETEKKNQYIEFPYLEDLNEVEYIRLKSGKWAVCDPGKRDLLYMKRGKKVIKYSNRQHLRKTKRMKYRKLMDNYKEKNSIKSIENELTSYNSKSCEYKKFKQYIKKKNEVNGRLFKKYEAHIFRKYKWYGYINRKRAETDLIRVISKTFGRDVTIIYGDWSQGDQMKNQISTPNLGLKRKLREYFKVYNIDEYRTSCLNYITHERCDNIYLPDKKGVYRKKHSILTYQMENKRKGCINRDNNSVNNMTTIVNQFLENGTRPYRFRRGTKLEDMKAIKDTNLDTFDAVIRLY